MEGSLNERIKETLLECRICLSTLTKPKSLPHCLHTFCEKCLINYVVHQLEPFSVGLLLLYIYIYIYTNCTIYKYSIVYIIHRMYHFVTTFILYNLL